MSLVEDIGTQFSFSFVNKRHDSNRQKLLIFGINHLYICRFQDVFFLFSLFLQSQLCYNVMI